MQVAEDSRMATHEGRRKVNQGNILYYITGKRKRAEQKDRDR